MEIVDFDTHSQASLLSENSEFKRFAKHEKGGASCPVSPLGEREKVKGSGEEAGSSGSLVPHTATVHAEKEETLSWAGESCSEEGGGAGTRLLSTSSSLPLLDEVGSTGESMGTLGDAAGRKVKSASGLGLGKRLGRKRNTVYPAPANFTAAVLDPDVKPARTVDTDIDEPLIAADTKLKGPPMFGRSNVLVAPAPLSENVMELAPSTNVLWAEGKDIGQGIDAVPHPNPKSDKKKKILPFGPERSRVAPSDSLGEESPKPLDSSVFMGESVHVVEETTGEKRMLPPEEMEKVLKKRLSMPSLSPSVPQAYIPISFAKEAIDTVVFDMKKMKNNHVHVVAKIREAYEEIEEDTKAQYMKFVLHLKEEHASKVSIYKQVIQILQEELNKAKEHWEGTSMSLENQNRKLLEENKELYKKIKDALALAEKEKEKTITEFSKVLDDERKRNTEDIKKHQLEMETLQAKHSQEVHKKLIKEPPKSKKNVLGQEVKKQKQQLQPQEQQEQESKPLEQPKTDLMQGTAEQIKSTSQPDSLERDVLDSQLKREVQSTQQELGELQKQLDDLVSLFESELSLHTALATTSTNLHTNLDGLANEMKEVESTINNWEMDFKESHDNVKPTESDWSESISQQHSKLQALSLQFDEQQYKLKILQSFQEMGAFSADLFSQTLEPEIEQAVTEVQSIGEPQQTIAVKETNNDTIKTEDVAPAKPSQKVAAPVKQVKTTSAADPKSMQELKRLKEQVTELKKKHEGDTTKIKSLEKELQSASKSTGGSIEDKKELKKREKELKDMSRQYEIAKKNLDKTQSQLKTMEAQLTELKKENDNLKEESKHLTQELQKLSISAKQGKDAEEKLKTLEQEVRTQAEELKVLAENYNSERVLRKKYYNIIEDMKGKIRVFCRARPLSSSELARNNFSVIESPDEYTVRVKTSRGIKEFQFDQMFVPEHPQAKVFEDTKNLIQSAVDGYNVCIFAYGQTGSGKTYTMIGGRDSNSELTAPGIAPRAFKTIFELIESNRKKFSFAVSCYMLELYNDRLLDLFQTNTRDLPKLDIKKDKKGLVYVQGATTNTAESSAALMELFDLGSKNRHVASTKMNAESSRSHLIIGIVLESTNLSTGTVHKGKLSLVDLAGSERAAKTGATAEQLKEAQSINKSLSALGDVISALSSGQEFVPYRNNKLTLLMQDSLGGNAKTLMFVNISPADYNTDETVVSLTYAARVKLITNDASKNAENKEIARLKGIIAKLKKGEAIDEEV